MDVKKRSCQEEMDLKPHHGLGAKFLRIQPRETDSLDEVRTDNEEGDVTGVLPTGSAVLRRTVREFNRHVSWNLRDWCDNEKVQVLSGRYKSALLDWDVGSMVVAWD